jgi:hypothetical protein
MRKAFALSLLLGVAACSARHDEGSPTPQNEPMMRDEAPAAPDRAAAGPGVTPTAAPGVAFDYHYAFRLAAERIQDAQQQHAAACEKMGLDHCRITGMRYRLIGKDEVEAMLAFKVDPALARAFGKQAIDEIVKADGLLAEAEITGTDAGAKIAEANSQAGSLSDQLKAVEAQLARSGLTGAERAELQNQAQALRDRIAAAQGEKKIAQATLATTPMTFDYSTDDRSRPRLRQALAQAGDNFLGGAQWLLIIAISLLPWAVAAGLLWFGWRRTRRWIEGRAPTPDAPADA